MASLMVQLFSKSVENVNKKYPLFNSFVRHTAVVPKKKTKRGTIRHRNIIASCCESLAARGFLRSYKPYNPAENVTEKVTQICQSVLGNKYDSNSPLSREDKYNLLNTCFQELKHSVPNSFIHKVVNVEDVIKFYETPVSTTVPYDELKNQDLPPNLHIQSDYVRFDPNSDTKFKGISAFPRSSTIVTSIQYRDKYGGYKTDSPFTDTEAIIRKKKPFT